MEKQEKYKYWKTLGDSIRIAIKNPKIFVPTIIAFLIGLSLLPISVSFQDPTFVFENLYLIFPLIIFNMVMFVVIYGWDFALLNQLVHGKKLELGKSFKRCLSFGLRNLGISLLIFILMMAVYMIIAIIITLLVTMFTLMNLLVVGAVLGGIIGVLFLVFLVMFITAAVQTMPVLAVEDKGVIETIKTAYKFYMQKKIYSLNIFLLSLLLIILLSLPAYIYQFTVIFGATLVPGIAIYSLTDMIIMSLFYIFPTLFMVILLIYYAKSYQIKKETVKNE